MNQDLEKWYAAHHAEIESFVHAIWEKPELPMEEFNACRITAKYMEDNGFTVKTYHCKYPEKNPNTVVATWGYGRPVIGIIGEYDALAGLGQNAVPYKSELEGAGHGCGHCQTTPACSAAAIAVKQLMEKEKIPGTLKYMSCPAEESGEGKIYMKQRGEFDDLDCCISWHPMNRDLGPTEGAMLAICSLNLEYTGKAAHASAMPHMGRSALDAAELTNIGIQYLREHVTDDVRMHYIYTDGGSAANIVPEHAALHYIIRARTLNTLTEVLERVKKVAKGAALMTETDVSFSVTSISSETFIVHSFNKFCYESIKKVPHPTYTEAEKTYAMNLYKNVMGKEAPEDVLPSKLTEPTGITQFEQASSDVGYLTHDVPMSRLFGWGMLRGVPVHHWGIVSASGMSIGERSAVYGSMAVAQCLYDILKHPDEIKQWKDELAAITSGRKFTPVFPGDGLP